MKAQVIEDHNGVPTGVFIPIKEWEKLKKQYPNIAEETSIFELSEEQKKILDAQEDLPFSEYQDNDAFVAELKKEYGL